MPNIIDAALFLYEQKENFEKWFSGWISRGIKKGPNFSNGNGTNLPSGKFPDITWETLEEWKLQPEFRKFQGEAKKMADEKFKEANSFREKFNNALKKNGKVTVEQVKIWLEEAKKK
jgi:hypothetical protein